MKDYLFFKVEGFHVKIRFSEILYIQAEKKYVFIATADNTYLSLVSISHLEELLPKHLFCRVHRSYIVSLEHINKFDNEILYVGDRRVPIAKQFRDALKGAIPIVKCEMKSIRLKNGNVDKLLQDISPQ